MENGTQSRETKSPSRVRRIADFIKSEAMWHTVERPRALSTIERQLDKDEAHTKLEAVPHTIDDSESATDTPPILPLPETTTDIKRPDVLEHNLNSPATQPETFVEIPSKNK